MKRLDRECVCVLDRKGVEVKGRIEERIEIGKRQKGCHQGESNTRPQDSCACDILSQLFSLALSQLSYDDIQPDNESFLSFN